MFLSYVSKYKQTLLFCNVSVFINIPDGIQDWHSLSQPEHITLSLTEITLHKVEN